MDERCGNCLYNRYDRDAGEFTCSNECSDNYGLPTGYIRLFKKGLHNAALFFAYLYGKLYAGLSKI